MAEPVPGLDAPGREASRIGDILRRVRESRSESLHAVSDYIKIRTYYLEALEASQYQALPADTYAIGFLKTYADYLGLDGAAAVAQFRREVSGRPRQPNLYMPQPEPEGRAPTAAIVLGGIFLALAVYALWYSLSAPDRASLTPPEVPVTTVGVDQLPAPVTSVAQTPVIAPPAPTIPAPVTNTPTVVTRQPVPVTTTEPAVTAPISPQPATTTSPPPAVPKGQTYGDTRSSARMQI